MRKSIFVISLLLAIMLTLTIGTLSASASGGCQKHYIKWGETLYSIGRLYDKAPWYIAHYNGIANPDYIQGGRVLCVPSYGPSYPGHYYGYDYGYRHDYKGYDHKGYYGDSYGKGYYGDYYHKGYDHGAYYGYKHPHKDYYGDYYSKGYDYGAYYDYGYDRYHHKDYGKPYGYGYGH